MRRFAAEILRDHLTGVRLRNNVNPGWATASRATPAHA